MILSNKVKVDEELSSLTNKFNDVRSIYEAFTDQMETRMGLNESEYETIKGELQLTMK